ncbi:MAG: hypothetical protein ACR2QV_05705 [Gammaproteobacteria bacterium]
MGNLELLAIGAGISVAAAALVVILRARGAAKKNGARYPDADALGPIQVTRNAPSRREKQFYGVSVQPGLNCCDAVKAIARERYLQGDAPKLPLPDCDFEECRCIMRPEDDRRTSIDRRHDAFSGFGWRPRRRAEAEERRKAATSETES